MSATELPGHGFEEFWTATPDTIKLMASSNLSFHVWKAARAPLLRALQANVDLAAESERRHRLLILQHAESVELWNALKDLSFECDGVTCTVAPSRETYNRTFRLLQQKPHLSPEALSGHGNAAGAALKEAP